MKNIKEYLINEAVNINDNILKSIENILSKHLVGKSFTFDLKELFDTENSNQNNITAYGFETTDDLIADCAGYLIEVFVWTKLKNELFNDPDFQNEWLNDVENQLHGTLQSKEEFKPIVRRSQKGQYWDFELPGVNAKFEIKARSIRNGKSGGFRYTSNQRNDKNLVYIYVKYIIENKSLKINSIEVKK